MKIYKQAQEQTTLIRDGATRPPHSAMSDIGSIVFLSGPTDMVRRTILLLTLFLIRLCLIISQTL
jgi:hypothetical protein